MVPSPSLQTVSRSLREIGRDFHARGWVLGTSGNFSAVVSRRPLRLAITASAASKGAIGARDVLLIDGDGRAVGGAAKRASAETPLHVALARFRDAGAVLHTHSVWGTVESERHAARGGLKLSGLEMLKGLEGVRTHEHEEWVPIFENDQDMPLLARRVVDALSASPAVHGFLLRGHGLYTWGEDLAQARRHVEILEFLLETTARLEALQTRSGGPDGSRQNS